MAGFNQIPQNVIDKLMQAHEEVNEITPDAHEHEYDDVLPLWGTMWSFQDSADSWWLEFDGGLEKMAACGFRIYEQEDYEYIFGIDGGGYDFYEAHWIPLYKARELRWHDNS